MMSAEIKIKTIRFSHNHNSKLEIITYGGATNNLKTFQEFSPKFMVKPQCKNNMNDGSPLHMSQLILWHGLNLKIHAPVEKQ